MEQDTLGTPIMEIPTIDFPAFDFTTIGIEDKAEEESVSLMDSIETYN